MEFGTVKFFDARPEKRFGFIVVDGSSEEIFFYYNDWNWIVAGKKKPEFNADYKIPSRPTAKPKEPQKGDRIAFQRMTGSRGAKAAPWMHEGMYQLIAEKIRNRPPDPIYRLMYQSSVIGEPLSEPRVTWQGTDLTDSRLPVEFNPVHDRGFFGNDDINVKKYWEVSRDGGKTWSSCDTPSDYKALFDSRGAYLRRRW